MTDNPIDLNNYAIPIEWTEKIDDVIYFENNPHSGFLILESHPNKKPKLVIQVKSGVLEGEFITNYSDGQMKAKSHMRNNLLHGFSQDFYPTGELELEGNFKNGKKFGLWKSFYKDGKIKIEQEYKDDKPNGTYKKYDEQGSLILSAIFSKGVLEKEIDLTPPIKDIKKKKKKNPNKVTIDDNESIESMIKKLDQLDGIDEKAGFCMTIYLHLTMKHGGSFKRVEGFIYDAKKEVKEGKKLYKPTRKRDFETLFDRVYYDMRLFTYLLHKKNRKLFNLFTEPIYQRVKKEETLNRWILWGIGLFVLIILIILMS
ncbi:MAG: toxin-antitoxin system YwqK family antitoxin [Flavobacteriaceae bacterium]|nr:toxin-antitoxin system YwqK family antitoxin [Flavobacteriaceae bacterium]